MARPSKHSPTDGRPEEPIATYHVRIVAGEGESAALDADVAGVLDNHKRLNATLSRAAKLQFGPGYVAALESARPSGSVSAVVLLSIKDATRAAATAVSELKRFAGAVEVAIAEALDEVFGGTSLGVSATLDTASPSVDDEAGTAGGPWERVAPILGAIGTGIGVLGLVTFVGGAVMWGRFQGEGLSAEEALSIVPSQSLVVVGARTLVPAVLIALLATVVLFIARTLLAEGGALVPADQELILASHRRGTRTGAIAFLVLVIEAAVLARALPDANAGLVALFVIVGLITAVVAACVAYTTGRFVYLAASTFVAVALFSGGVDYARARSNSDVRAAAVVRDHKKAVIGFYIAETGARVYLGRIKLERNPKTSKVTNEIDGEQSRIVGISKSEITDLAIGPPQAPSAAKEQAETLANELCGLQVPAPPDPPKAASSPAPSEPQKCWLFPPGLSR